MLTERHLWFRREMLRARWQPRIQRPFGRRADQGRIDRRSVYQQSRVVLPNNTWKQARDHSGALPLLSAQPARRQNPSRLTLTTAVSRELRTLSASLRQRIQ